MESYLFCLLKVLIIKAPCFSFWPAPFLCYGLFRDSWTHRFKRDVPEGSTLWICSVECELVCFRVVWPSTFRFFHSHCFFCPLRNLCLTSRPSFGARAGCSCSSLGGESPPLHAEESGLLTATAVFSFIGRRGDACLCLVLNLRLRFHLQRTGRRQNQCGASLGPVWNLPMCETNTESRFHWRRCLLSSC